MNELAVCVKNSSGLVRYQNRACIRVCGNQRRKVCEKGCMEFLLARNGGAVALKGPVVLPQRLLGTRYFDIVLVPARNWFLSLLYARQEAVVPLLWAALELELTPRELEVARLKERGFTNREIAARLFVSRATVKTHLNHIHRKRAESGTS